ncbi:MAG: substrate-binding domain-containing protein [Oscillospiraceae bacterium]|nr:substrate-binding domain-containing protein [Oscillospiraceae bacterium]
MKKQKLFSLVLAVILALSVVACANQGDAPAPSSSDAPNTADNSPVATSPPAGSESSPPTAQAPVGGEHVGYWDDPVDHYARPAYRIAHYSFGSGTMIDRYYEALQKCQEKMNITVDFVTANGDDEKFINNLELMSDRDGLLVDTNPNLSVRAFEVLTEMGKPWIAFSMPFQNLDPDPLKICWPTVALDGFAVGTQSTKWLIDNYKDYWGEIDTKKLGLITITVSTLPLFSTRSDGARDLFQQTFPDSLYIEGDIAGQQFTAEAAYNMISAYVSANPGTEYWMINVVMAMVAPGVARAIETLGVEDRVLITCCESPTAVEEWDSGYDGSWVSAVGIAEEIYAVPATAGLVALIDGRATPDTLWADSKRAPYGDDYALFPMELEVITRDTYKAYFENIDTTYFS